MACIGLAACAAASCAEDTLVPLTVCEIVRDLPAQDGKVVAAIGRYSFRSDGRSMGEQTCDTPGPAPTLWLVEDLKEGPKPPEPLNLDKAALKKKFFDGLSRRGLRRRPKLRTDSVVVDQGLRRCASSEHGFISASGAQTGSCRSSKPPSLD